MKPKTDFDSATKDTFLSDRLEKYDRWLDKGLISFSSKVVPVKESLDVRQWVLPTEQVMEILGKSDSIAVQDCMCRTHYKRCDHPMEVCLLLNKVADKNIKTRKARPVDLEEAGIITRNANLSGLVHLSFYMPDHEIFALCSCCPCCCHDLQIVKKYGRKDIMVHSEYIALTRDKNCIHCLECSDRCVFGARTIKDERLFYTPKQCLGCGLCITTCPGDAIFMALRPPMGIK